MGISKRNRAIAFGLVAGSLLLGGGRPAGAGFIASDIGSGGTFNTLSGYNLTGPKVFTGQGYGLAVEFSVGGTAPVAFGSATLALAYRGGSNAADVVLAADNGGLPGTALETIHLSNISAIPSLVTATSTVHSPLAPGSNYWLEAIATGDTNMTWFASSQGAANHLAYRLDTGSGPGPWGLAPGSADPAFSISSVGVGNPAIVSAPPSLTLFGLGLAGLVGRGFLRKLGPA